MSDSDLTRERWRRLAEPPTDPGRPAFGSAAFVGQVVTATPLDQHYILVNPVSVLGTATEGGAGTLTAGTATVPVLLLGTASTGDRLICRMLGGRWAAGFSAPYGGSPTHGSPGCLCTTTPNTVYYTITGLPSYFNGNGSGQIVYGPRPVPTDLPDPWWYDTVQRTDIYGTYVYSLQCLGGGTNYQILKLYITGTYVTPGTWQIMFTFTLGGAANSCSPWAFPDQLAAFLPGTTAALSS